MSIVRKVLLYLLKVGTGFLQGLRIWSKPVPIFLLTIFSITGIVKAEEAEGEKAKLQRRIEENMALKEMMAKRDIEVRYQGKNRIIVDAVLNEKVKAKLIVDTGAPIVLLTPKVASRIWNLKTLRRDRIDIAWLDGTKEKGIPVIIKSLEVGKAKAKGVNAVIANVPSFWEEGAEGLLGMTFLNNFHVKIDTERRVLVLKQK